MDTVELWRSGVLSHRSGTIVATIALLVMSSAFCSESASSSNPLFSVYDAVTQSSSPSLSESSPSCVSFDSGCKLIVSTVLEAPYMMLKSDGALLTGNDRFEGYVADILQRLASSIGFQYEIRLSRGVKHDDDVYFDRFLNGVVSEVKRGTAHIGAGPLIVSNATMEFVDFTQPFLSLRSSALIRRPPSVHPSIRRSSPSHRRPINRDEDGDDHVITDYHQLLQSNLTYGVIHGGIAYRMMSSSPEPLMRVMWSRMATRWPRAFVHSVQEGVERATRGGYAFIIDTPTAEYLAGRRPCDLYATEPFLDVMTYAFVTRKVDFRLRHAIDRELRRLKWSDDLQAMFLRWWKSECVGKVFRSGAASKVARGDATGATRYSDDEIVEIDYWSSKTSHLRTASSSLMMFCSFLVVSIKFCQTRL